MDYTKRLILFFILLFGGSACTEQFSELEQQGNSISIESPLAQAPEAQNIPLSQKQRNCQNISLNFIQTDNTGNTDFTGLNYVIMFNPKSKELDFKVSLGISHPLYAKDAKGKIRKEYIPKPFYEIISDANSTLNGRRPIAAINGDYIDKENKPQGLNISRGVEYSGAFKDKRSSFAISGVNLKREGLRFKKDEELKKSSITTWLEEMDDFIKMENLEIFVATWENMPVFRKLAALWQQLLLKVT